MNISPLRLPLLAIFSIILFKSQPRRRALRRHFNFIFSSA